MGYTTPYFYHTSNPDVRTPMMHVNHGELTVLLRSKLRLVDM